MSYNHRLRTFVCAMALLSLGLVGSAVAQTTWSGAVSSDWDDADNWDAGVPTSTVDAVILEGTHNPSLNADGSAQVLKLGGLSGLVGVAGYLTVPGNALTVDEIFLGMPTGTTSEITQSDGTVTCNGYLWAGSTDPTQTGAGNYTMTGGELNLYNLDSGECGTSVFHQSGGQANIGYVAIADNYHRWQNDIPATPGQGSYLLEAGEGETAVLNVDDEMPPQAAGAAYVGLWGGYGTLTVQGQGSAIMYATSIGVDAPSGGWCPLGATGEINLHGNGQIILSDYLSLSGNDVASGTLNQDGGTLTLKRLDGGEGTYTHNFTGGTLNISELTNMDLVNGGGTVNIGGTGAVTTLTTGALEITNNIAVGKTATLSSHYGDPDNDWFPASNAVDEVFTNFAHSDHEENALWQVDLTGGGNISIDDVVVTARYNGWTFQLSNFHVRVIADDDSLLYEGLFITEQSEILDPGEKLWIKLPSAVDGRYVQVQLNGFNLGDEAYPGQEDYLSITEVEVGDVAMVYDGDYSQVATATLGIELDPDNELCDKLDVGTLTLAGTLDVTALSTGFASGQVFDILDWETLVGEFDTVNLPTLTGSLSWDDSNLYVTGELEVVGGPAVPGDATGDGNVNDDDAARLAEFWGATVKDEVYTWWQMGDFDDDHYVGPKDAAIMAGNWGYTSEAESGAVPEPGVLAVLLMSAAALLATTRRRRHPSSNQ